MKAHIILAHPESKSFNGRLADLSRSGLETTGYEVTLSDLYTMRFDPCEAAYHYKDRADSEHFHAQTEQRYNAEHDSTPVDVAEEQERLLACDVLVVHFPLWWFGPPAILKGWMDRVFVYGAVYRGAMRYDTGICRGKKMIACITAGASAESCSHNGREGDTRLLAWPIVFPFRYLGFGVLQPAIFHGVGGVASIEVGDDGFAVAFTFADCRGLPLSLFFHIPAIVIEDRFSRLGVGKHLDPAFYTEQARYAAQNYRLLQLCTQFAACALRCFFSSDATRSDGCAPWPIQ